METANKLKIVLANAFAFYLKVHFFHWNVTGPDFPQYHKFLEGIYEEVYGSIDDIAENIRMLDAYAPGSFTRFSELTSIQDALDPAESPEELFKVLLEDNKRVLDSLEECYLAAENEGKHATSNFVQERMMAHSKHQWMLSSVNKV